MKFTLRQLGYFIAAAETGSITLASRRASISQPAISTAISHIERELGVQLFLRHHAQGLSLTPAGRALLREGKLLLNQAESLHSAAADAGHQLHGELTVGWLETLAPIIMPELAQSFRKAHPDTRLSSREGDQEVLLRGLREVAIEAAITCDLQLGEDIAFMPLATLPPYAVFSVGHVLAREGSVRLAQLAPLPLVLLDMAPVRDYVRTLFSRERLEPSVAWSSAKPDVVRTLVANGYGYTIDNVRPRGEVALDGRRVCRVPIGGDPPAQRLGIATLKQLKKTRLVEVFERHCQKLLSDSEIPGMTSAPVARKSKSRRR